MFHQLHVSIGKAEWREIPWSIIPKTPRDVLSEIMFDTGAFLQDLDTFRRRSSWAEDGCDTLVAKCNSITERVSIWSSPLQPMIQKYDFTKVSSFPQQLSTDGHVEFLALTHQYWVLCMCLESSLQFLRLSMQNKGGSNATITANKINPTLEFWPTDGYFENEQQEYDEVVSLLSGPKMHAYRIAHTVHLFFEPSFGVAVYHLALFSVGFGLRLLNTIEGSVTVSPERNTLLNSFQWIMHGRWMGTPFDNNTITNTSWAAGQYNHSESLPDGDKMKRASLLWWTKE